MSDREKGVFVGLLDGTFNLLSRTWTTSLILGAVLFIPTSFFFGWAYGSFLDAIKGLAGMPENDYGLLLASLGIGYLWIALAAFAQAVVFLFVRACVTEHAARAAKGEPADTFSVVAYVVTHTFARLLGQRVLQVMILSITFAAACLIAGIAIGILGALSLTVLAALIGSILGLAGFAVVIWLSVRYTVTLESLVIDRTGIEQSIDHSMALVSHRWWRVFGYTLLFGLMVSFASSLIATPIMFFSTVRQFIHNLEAVLRDTSGQQNFNETFLRLLAGLGRRLGILEYVQSLLACFVSPVFMTLLFLELKKQPEGEAAPASEQPPAEAGSAEGSPLPTGTLP